MSGRLEQVKEAIAALDDTVEPSDVRQLIDCLERKFCELVLQASERGEHLLHGCSPTSWVAQTCKMSKHAAADRLCIGEQLRSLPRLAEALERGDIGYQAASTVCHLSDQLGEKRDHIDEEDWIGYAQRFSIKELRYLAGKARHAWDPEGFENDNEEDYDRRYLHLSPLGRMYKLDAVLDWEGGEALKTAIDALSKPLGARDSRSAKQRRADALVELTYHALDTGRLPKRSGVRPHIALTTTVEALKGELGAEASELHSGMPVSSKTVQRLACDGTMHRVLKADSMVIDVGRATRAISGSQRRGLNAKHRCCVWPGCDRPVSWTAVHHIEFWGKGGETNLPNMVPLCYFHHRLVHEGGWQIVKSAGGLQFIPPERDIIRRSRAPGRYFAA